MIGTITRIVENDFGQKYGFIKSEDVDYYFDNRYLSSGTMADFFEDDMVEFLPLPNPKDSKKMIAQTVNLKSKETMKAKKAIQKQNFNDINSENITYNIPDQFESSTNRWYFSGKSEKLILRDIPEDEISILKKIWKALYNTNVGHFKARDKNMTYRYALFGPTKQFVIQLGLEKVEFALIFCDRDEFQRRTLEEAFLYLTNNIIPKVRISGHFYLLVTKYNDIVMQIEKPEIQGALQCSVIPFAYNEFLETDINSIENLLLGRFKRFLFERNFFSYSEPINDRIFLFGGREQYAKGIVDRSISGDHSGIFGLRKSGKTSVINIIKQELDNRQILYVSYRCVEFIRYNWYQTLKKISRDLYRKLDLEENSQDYTEENALEAFSEEITKIITNQRYSQLILIFDEIEQIAFDSTFDEKWQDILAYYHFWSVIITFCEKFPGKLSLVVAGINPSISEIDFLPSSAGKSTPRNPMYKKLSNENYLSPFAYEQTKRMVNELGKYMGLSFDDEVCFELQRDFGGHPYFTRQMCKIIVIYIREKALRNQNYDQFSVTRPLYIAVKNCGNYEVESNQWCKDILKELKAYYQDEYQYLLKIANREVTTFEQVRKNPSIIPHLIGYGLVRFDIPSKEMEVSINIVKQYLIQEKEYKKPFGLMTLNEIDDEIQDGIATCEKPLRKLIRDVLTTLYAPSDAERFIKSTHSYTKDNRQRNLSSLSINELLDPRMVTLHFYTLSDIICSTDPEFGDHYEKFKNKLTPYTKNELKSYLANIYVARNAADHHYEVQNEATLLNFRSSFGEIKKLLKNLGYIG